MNKGEKWNKALLMPLSQVSFVVAILSIISGIIILRIDNIVIGVILIIANIFNSWLNVKGMK